MEFQKEIRIFLEDCGECQAEMVLREEKDTYNIVKTYVNERHRGQGLSGALLSEAIRCAEKQEKKLKADCTFARKALEKRQAEQGEVWNRF